MANPTRDNSDVPTAAIMVTGLPELAPAEVATAKRLTTAIARGDEAAFTELFDRYHAPPGDSPRRTVGGIVPAAESASNQG